MMVSERDDNSVDTTCTVLKHDFVPLEITFNRNGCSGRYVKNYNCANYCTNARCEKKCNICYYPYYNGVVTFEYLDVHEAKIIVIASERGTNKNYKKDQVTSYVTKKLPT